MTSRTLHLLMRQRLTSDGCYFAELGQAARNDQIHHALNSATTWAEFRELLPPGEFEGFPFWTDHGGQQFYDATGECSASTTSNALDVHDDENVIRPQDPFSPEEIPGFADGDYPPFLDLDQDRWLPAEFCSRFGKRITSFTSGSWW